MSAKVLFRLFTVFVAALCQKLECSENALFAMIDAQQIRDYICDASVPDVAEFIRISELATLETSPRAIAMCDLTFREYPARFNREN